MGIHTKFINLINNYIVLLLYSKQIDLNHVRETKKNWEFRDQK